MPSHRESRRLPYPAEWLFELVADVESYPQFLPFWRETKVRQRSVHRYLTDQRIGIGPLQGLLRTETLLQRPERIDITASHGPFRDFSIGWQFIALPDTGCRIDFAISCEAASPLLHGFVTAAFAETARVMVHAFEHRARSLYRPGHPYHRAPR